MTKNEWKKILLLINIDFNEFEETEILYDVKTDSLSITYERKKIKNE